jgi:hypothetical protein
MSADGFTPASSAAIGSRMDSFMASITKGYASGFRNSTTINTAEVEGNLVVTRLSLNSGRLFWVGTIALVAVLLLSILAALTSPGNASTTFDLHNLVSIVQEGAHSGKRSTDQPATDLKPMWRLVWFVALEIGFLGFAALGLRTLILPASLSKHVVDVKGIATLLTIAWQTLALFPVVAIITHTFSTEWSYLYNETLHLVPGTTDRVSIPTAGWWARLCHGTAARRASPSFRAALLAALVILILHNISPGTIGVATVVSSIAIPESIANITDSFLGGTNASTGVAATTFSQTTMYLQGLANYTYGFSTSPSNCAVGWPDFIYLRNESSLEYPSDALCWSSQCAWEAPAFPNCTSSRRSSCTPRAVAPTLSNTTWSLNAEGNSQNAVSCPP